jgi:hypothetical protein
MIRTLNRIGSVLAQLHLRMHGWHPEGQLDQRDTSSELTSQVGFPFCLFPPIRGLGLTGVFDCVPLTWESSSAFTALGLLRLLLAFGLVFALGPLEFTLPC